MRAVTLPRLGRSAPPERPPGPSALGASRPGYDVAVATIDHSDVIECPAASVWSILEDVRRLPELSASTTEIRDAPERLTTPGQSFEQVVGFAGKRFESRWVVLAIDPGRSLTIEGDVGYGVRYTLTERVEPLDAGRCRFQMEITYRLPFGPLGRLANRLGVEHRARSEAAAVVANLKALAEGSGC